MQGRHIFHLHGNLTVTSHAAVFHLRRLPRRSVTGFAVSARLGVRRDAAKHLSALRVQRAGIVQYAAPRVGVPRNDQGGNDRGDHSHP